MQISYKWLKDYIAFDWSVDELADRLTMIGTAVEKIEPLYEKFTGVVIARIEKVDPHPSRSELSVCVLNAGTRSATVVCGAPNVHPGQYSPYAPPEAILPGSRKVTAAKIAGVPSPGFLCSEAELGLSEDADVLMVLDPESAEAGADLWEALELDDWILRFELTPNRPDCMSALGIAREIGALTGVHSRRPEFELAETEGAATDRLSIVIDDPSGCPRYAGRIIEKVTLGRSPFWLKQRLHSAGIRAINTIVDITNYVMIETGQPLHAFDLEKFSEPQVVVRAARKRESFTTLDGEKRKLPEDAVLITDGKNAVAIGGVMGGLDSEVSETTKTILLESAYFIPTRIRRTRKALGMDTESAIRFEKGVDPNGVTFALDRAAALMAELAGGEVLRGSVDVYPQPIEAERLELRPNRANSIIGTDLASPRMIDILSSLEFAVTAGKTVSVTVPTFRPDITRELDLIEEIARIADYEEIPVRRGAAGRIPTAINPVTSFEEQLGDILVGEGLYEVVTNSLVDPKRLTAEDAKRVAALRNALSEDLSVMRPSLCGSLLNVVAYNFNRQVPSVRIFEIGRVFAKNGKAYDEHRSVAIMLAGEIPVTRWESSPRATDFFDLKGCLTTLFDRLHVTVEFCPDESPYFRPGASFKLAANETILGYAGMIAESLARRYEVKAPVWAAFLTFEQLRHAAVTGGHYQPVPRFPRSERDCAVVVDKAVLAGELVEVIKSSAGKFVESVDIFDIYTGKQVAEGKKSVAISVVYRSSEGTLTDKQVNVAHKKAVAELMKKFNAELRD